jgi:hypothetical protein
MESRRESFDVAARLHADVLAKAAALERRIEDQRREVDSFDGRLSEAGRLRKGTLAAGSGTRNAVSLVQEASVEGERTILLATFATITLSILAHGLSAGPLTARYVRWYGSHPREARPMESVTVTAPRPRGRAGVGRDSPR